MVQKCKCGRKLIKFPLWKGQEDGESFNWNKLIWINLFKIDWIYIMLFAVILFSIFTYKADIKTCEEIITNPLEYCEESKACKIIEERSQSPLGTVDIENIPEFNPSG